MKHLRLKKHLALLLAFILVMSLLPMTALADPPQPSATATGMRVMEDSASTADAAQFIQNFSYCVQITVKNNNSTYSISPSVTLYAVRNNTPTEVGSATVSLPDTIPKTCNIMWTPMESGAFTLKAVVSVDGGTKVLDDKYTKAVTVLAATQEIKSGFTFAADTTGNLLGIRNTDGTTLGKTVPDGGGGIEVAIPGDVGGISITKISKNAFIGQTGITKVTMPNTVTTVEALGGNTVKGGFNDCANLKTVVFEDGGTAKLILGNWTFRNLTKFESVTFSTTRETVIGSDSNGQTFWGCTGLKNMNLGDSRVSIIVGKSFQSCTSLTEVTLPATVTQLQSLAASGGVFDKCTALKTVTFKNGGTEALSFGLQTFYNLPALTSVTLPTDRPISIGNRVFEECKVLTTINLGDCDIQAIGTTAFKNTGLTDVTIKNRNATVSADAFDGTTPLTLHGWYGSQAQSCAGSANVTFVPLDKAEDAITDGTFVVTSQGELIDYLGNATAVTIPAAVNGQAVTKIGSYALRAHTNITYLDIKAQITELGDNAFKSFTGLVSMTMPLSLKKVGISAFEGCTALQKINFGENSVLEEIGERAFYGDAALLYIDLPNTLKTIGPRAFYGAGFNYIQLPSSITSIGKNAFATSSLVEIDLPEALANATLDTYLFYNCTRLSRVTLPEGLTSIGEFWFTGCTALKQLAIPDSVTTLGKNAFQNSGLESLVIPAGVTVIPDVFAASSKSLKSVTFLGPVTAIGNTAFKDCIALREISLPVSLKTAGTNVFYGCTSLKETVIPDGVTSLGGGIFRSCTALETLAIPKTVTTIGTDLIADCVKSKLVVYVERGSAAAGSANISQNYCTLCYTDFTVKVTVTGAAQTYQNTAFAVKSGAAQSYGLVSLAKPYQVSVLDALVLTHQAMYSWAPGTLGGELVVGADGKMTKMFGVDAGNAGFTVNGSPLPISHAASTTLKEGDVLLFFTGKSSTGADQKIAWFEFQGAQCTSVSLAKNRGYVFTLKTADGPVAGIPIYMLDSAGHPTGASLGTTDSGGNVTLTVSSGSGTVMIAGVDQQDRYFFTRLAVTISEQDLMLKTVAFTATPGFDVSSALSNGQKAGAFIKAGEDGKDISAGYDPAHSKYNVYVNRNISALRFSSLELDDAGGAQSKKLSVYVDGSTVPMVGADSISPDASGAYTVPAFAFTGDVMTLRLVVRYTENGQNFEFAYDIRIIRDTGDMAAYPGIIDIQGALRTSVASTYKRGDSTASIYYDHGMTAATLDVKVQEGTDVYLKISGTDMDVKQTITAGPVVENGRSVVTYRVTLNDFTKGWLISAKRGSSTPEILTVSTFREKSPYDGVYTPDRIVRYMQAPGQFVSSTPGGTLMSNTGWSKYFSLGGFGGYIDYYYETPITNDSRNPYGVDFIIYGNAFSAGGAGEAASVQVSSDGVTWYYLAGQRHYELSTYIDYTTLLDGSVVESLLVARKGEYGYSSNYPDKVSFGYVDISACSANEYGEGIYYVNARAGNPYRDIADLGSVAIGDGFDLSWAVDRVGKPVELKNGIRYIRVQNAVDAYNGSLGEVSTEIGTVTRVNPDTQLSPVGVTDAPVTLTFNGRSLSELGLTPISNIDNGSVTYYQLDLKGQSSTVKVAVKGADSDNIYVNAERYKGSADYTGILNSGNSRIIRVIVQNGTKEPRIYVVTCINGGNPNANAELAGVIVNPGNFAATAGLDGTTYALSVGSNVNAVYITPNAVNPNSSILFNGISMSSGNPTDMISLNTGVNTYTIKVTSPDKSAARTYTLVITRAQNTSDDEMTVTFTLLGTAADGENGPVNTLAAGNLTTWLAQTTVKVGKGARVYDVFTDTLSKNGYSYIIKNNGNYVSSITTPGGVTLAEFTNGPLSGWMYTVNGTHPTLGFAEYILKNGDVIVWHYTDDYTKEEGSQKWNETKSGSASQTITPPATVNGNTASVSLTMSDIKDAIVSAKESGGAIVVAPTGTGSAGTVQVSLPADALSAAATQTNAALTIQTCVGTVTFPNPALDSIVSQASGGTVTMSVGTVDKTALTADQQKVVGSDTVYDISVLSGTLAITSFSGASLSISLPYTLKPGEDGANVTVWYLDASGKLQQMTATYDKATGLATFTTDHLSKYLVRCLAPWTNPFTDVTSADWFYGAVKYVSQNSLMSGTTATAFEPNTDMTRAMIVTVLYRLAGKPAVTGTSGFSDVAAGQWYTDAVTWASANKIVGGYGSGKFGTNDGVTREQLAVILMNYAKYKSYDTTKTADLSYTDASKIDSWATVALQWAAANGLITGTTPTTMSPTVVASRAQVATILMRFVEIINK